MKVQRYRPLRTLVVEAMRWTGTDENTKQLSEWLDHHDAMFEKRGKYLGVPDDWRVAARGEWIVHTGERFIVMSNDAFQQTYELIENEQ